MRLLLIVLEAEKEGIAIMIKKISLAIFDMDGLMFDTERISTEMLMRAGKEYGYNISYETVMKMIGMNSKGCEKIMRENFEEGFPLEDIRKLKTKLFLNSIYDNGVPVKKGLYELLEFLNKKSVPAAVATSTKREIAEGFLKSASVMDKFKMILCGDEVKACKPDPEIFLSVAQRMNCRPEECIVLEDSENGIIAASRAKMIPFMVPDLKEPSKETERLVYKRFNSLLDVKNYLEGYL